MLVKNVKNAYIDLINKDNVGLAGLFSVNPRYCANEDFYKHYLLFDALFDLNSGNTVTHVFIDEGANRIMGYVSLRTNSIVSKGDNNKVIGKPALEISVLAVDKDYERRGVGTILISQAISIATKLHKEYAGVKYLILAADTQAVGFYEKMGFSKFSNQWEQIPAETFSSSYVPMGRFLDFESEQLESFCDDLEYEE